MAKSIACALVGSRLDYANSVLLPTSTHPWNITLHLVPCVRLTLNCCSFPVSVHVSLFPLQLFGTPFLWPFAAVSPLAVFGANSKLSSITYTPSHPAPQIQRVSRWHCALYKLTYFTNILTYLHSRTTDFFKYSLSRTDWVLSKLSICLPFIKLNLLLSAASSVDCFSLYRLLLSRLYIENLLTWSVTFKIVVDLYGCIWLVVPVCWLTANEQEEEESCEDEGSASSALPGLVVWWLVTMMFNDTQLPCWKIHMAIYPQQIIRFTPCLVLG